MSTDKLTKSVKEEPDKSDKAFTIRSGLSSRFLFECLYMS